MARLKRPLAREPAIEFLSDYRQKGPVVRGTQGVILSPVAQREVCALRPRNVIRRSPPWKSSDTRFVHKRAFGSSLFLRWKTIMRNHEDCATTVPVVYKQVFAVRHDARVGIGPRIIDTSVRFESWEFFNEATEAE